jgi:sigma-B regulation protein RsbU (phosphoserine phosphatase)
MSESSKKKPLNALQEDFEDFFEKARCGYLVLEPNGRIIRANTCIAGWIGCGIEELDGKKFSDLLSVGGKIYYETHLWPLLRMQGHFSEIALELSCANDKRLPVLVNAYERRGENDDPQFIRLMVLKAADRLAYEHTLEVSVKNAEEIAVLREQFIAVLGHDLRNPLQAIMHAAGLLELVSSEKEVLTISRVLKNSSSRMNELINKIMDFAQVKMGSGLVMEKKQTDVTILVSQIIEEIRLAWPKRIIEIHTDITEPVFCDPPRIAQLFSNLLANALTHGAQDKAVLVSAKTENNFFEFSVSNQGIPIAKEIMPLLFQPFTRESSRSSHHGLGLGLYIASEVARAHGGSINVDSTAEKTIFVFTMPANFSDHS